MNLMLITDENNLNSCDVTSCFHPRLKCLNTITSTACNMIKTRVGTVTYQTTCNAKQSKQGGRKTGKV